jgi:hypothetical protein
MSRFKHTIISSFIGAVAVAALALAALGGAGPAAHAAPRQRATPTAVRVRPQDGPGKVFVSRYSSQGACTWNGWVGQAIGEWASWSCDLWVDWDGTAYWDLYYYTNLIWF